MVSHARYVIFQMAEVAVPKQIFRAILERIHRLKPISNNAAYLQRHWRGLTSFTEDSTGIARYTDYEYTTEGLRNKQIGYTADAANAQTTTYEFDNLNRLTRELQDLFEEANATPTSSRIEEKNLERTQKM